MLVDRATGVERKTSNLFIVTVDRLRPPLLKYRNYEKRTPKPDVVCRGRVVQFARGRALVQTFRTPGYARFSCRSQEEQ